LTGALADFETFVEIKMFDYFPEAFKKRRIRWIEALKAGENPFTSDELEELRRDEGNFNFTS